MQKLIHFNPSLSHQCDHAQAFLNCGFAATSRPDDKADVHVISGPWFAYDQWRDHPRVLMIDRAWWGDPEYVSIGWLKNGKRVFATGDLPRPKPEYEAWKTREDSCLILANYGQDISDIAYRASQRFVTVNIRLHPADGKNQVSLSDALRLHDVCIGHSGTGLFEALMQGVPVICTDVDNECMPVCSTIDKPLYRGDRSEWLHAMSYKQFGLDEIADAWRLLENVI